MSFTELLASLGANASTPYHLDSTGLKVVAGPAPEDQRMRLKTLTEKIASSTLSVEELDQLDVGIKNLTLTPPASGLLGLFSTTVKASDTDEYKQFISAKEHAIDTAHRSDAETITKSLEYLLQRDDVLRFARYFRGIYLQDIALSPPSQEARQQTDATLQAAIEALANKYPHCPWIARVREDFDWPCSLVPRIELAHVPKFLDLAKCSERSIRDIIQAHTQRGYLCLKLVLACSQDALLHLGQDGLLQTVIELDLRNSPSLDWNAIQDTLAKIQELQSLSLPTTLQIPDEIQWDKAWKQELKECVLRSLQRLRGKQDCTFVTNLMKEVSGRRSLSRYNRVAVSFLLSEPTLLKKLSSISSLSVSGIQKTTLDLLLQMKFKERPITLYLSYCPHITRNTFKTLFEKFQFCEFFLWGCSQVDDSYFVDHPLLRPGYVFTGKLLLTATSVSEAMCQKLQKAHPDAAILYSSYYLARRPQMQESFGLDRQGLSDAAIHAVIHLRYTGYFSLITLAAAKEILSSKAIFFADPNVHERLKEYCRYILSINVDRSNVCDLYHFARTIGDCTLTYVCRMYLETLFPPDVPAMWQSLSDEQRLHFTRILKDPPPAEVSLTFQDDIIYKSFEAETIDFVPQIAPFSDLVQRDEIYIFAKRFCTLDDATRHDLLQSLAQRFPKKRWLQHFAKHPEVLEDFGQNSTIAVLSGETAVALEILRKCQKDNWFWLRFRCTQETCIQFLQTAAQDKVHGVVLQECENFQWHVIRDHVTRLTQYFLPKSLELFAAFRMHFEESAQIREALNLFHVFAMRKNISMSDFVPTGPNFLFVAQQIALNQARATVRELSSSLAYRQDVTKEMLKDIASWPTFTTLQLTGCIHVDDSFIPPFFGTLRELDLRGTCVSKEKVAQIQTKRIHVLYDESFLDAYETFKRIKEINFTPLSQAAFEAVIFFNYTGYWPQLTVAIAKELLRCKDEALHPKYRLALLKEHCLKFLAVNVTRENVLELYQLADEFNDPQLRFVTHFFIECYCNPYYEDLVYHDEHPIFRKIVCKQPPKLCELYVSYDLEKQSTHAITPHSEGVKITQSANFSDQAKDGSYEL